MYNSVETKAIFDEGTEEDSGLRKRKQAEAEYEDETWQSRLSADYAGRGKKGGANLGDSVLLLSAYLGRYLPRCCVVGTRPLKQNEGRARPAVEAILAPNTGREGTGREREKEGPSTRTHPRGDGSAFPVITDPFWHWLLISRFAHLIFRKCKPRLGIVAREGQLVSSHFDYF